MTNVAPIWQQLYQQSQKVDLHKRRVEQMQLNHDLSKSAQVDLRQSKWLPSPALGVKRLVLEREGGEKTIRATSIVAYAPNSQFASHGHPQGEEFYVLAGTFSDQHGDYPAGTYVRNPPGSSHAPFSQNGCLIWVKLQQFLPEDNKHSVIATFEADQNQTSIEYQRQTLFDDYENVELLSAKRDYVLSQNYFDGGVEVLVLAGQISHGGCNYQEGSWLRFSAKSSETIEVSKNTKLLVKSRHLGR